MVASAARGALGRSDLSEARALVRLMGQQPLDCAPGAVFAYADIQYIVLGRVIEHVTGQPYEDAVMRLVLRSAGAAGARIEPSPLIDGHQPHLWAKPGHWLNTAYGTDPRCTTH